MLAELEKLEANLGGVAEMRRQPDAVFIVDLRKEQLAVREAQRLGLPVIALVDTNCDPDEAEYVIPGNDDAIRSCNLIVRAIADGVAAGRTKVTEKEMARAEAQAQAQAQARAQATVEAEATAGPSESEPEPLSAAEPQTLAERTAALEPEPAPAEIEPVAVEAIAVAAESAEDGGEA